MKIKNFLFLSSLALIAAGCSESQEIDAPTPTPGAEVHFGASLAQSKTTRTVYGTEANNAFPIYWATGDQVIVTSPSGMDVPTAIYNVTLPDEGDANYAKSLDKAGDAGVQWGNNQTADFYSVYPATTSDKVSGTTFSLTMPNRQYETVSTDNNLAKPNMDACFMYAVTKGVQNGSDVNLGYEPLSTAIRFKLLGPTSTQDNQTVTVSSVVLHAPVAIAGDFTVNLSSGEPSVELGSTTYNEITVYAAYENGAYLTLGSNDVIELNAFIIPQKNLEIYDDEWYLTVTLADGRTFKKILNGTATGNKSMALTAGQIHRLPDLPALTVSETWDKSKWMTYIPRNVYLSEISIPGSWNSVNSDFQASTDIKTQYSEGVRAFHLDTRWRANKEPDGIADANIYSASDKYVGDLSVADCSNTVMMKESWYPSSTSLGRVMVKNNPTFATRLSEITSKVAKDEYMVVVCTFANGSYHTTTKTWMQAISDACDNNTAVYDAKNLTKETVVGDVLGKVIVIVCCEDEISNLTLPSNSKCLFTYLPQTLSQTNCTASYNEDALYYGSKATTGLSFYDTQAQVTATGSSAYSTGRGWAPSIGQRQQQVTNVTNKSKEYYGTVGYANDHWYYLGLGGQTINSGADNPNKDTQAYVASRLNPYINTIVTGMNSTSGYYPVGIVLMNYVTTDSYTTDNSTKYDVHGLTTVGNILLLNNKFKKAADETWQASQSGTTQTSSAKSAAAGYSSGMTDNGTQAIGWTEVK